MDVYKFIEIHEALINYDYNFINIYDSKYVRQEKIKKYMFDFSVKNIKINYNGKFTICWSFVKDNIIFIKCEDLISLHLARLIKNKLNGHIKNIIIGSYEIELNFFGKFLMELNCLLSDNFLDYCTICNKELKIRGLEKVSCCEKDECIKLLSQIPIDNKLSKLFEYDPKLIELLCSLLKSAVIHPKAQKIYNVIPKLPNVNTFADFKNYVDKYLKLEKINIVHSEIPNEIELINKLGIEMYSLIKISINDNYFSLSTLGHLDNLQNFNIGLATNIYDKMDNRTIHLIKLNYTASIENSFNTGFYLYHGSSFENWYSIIKNGLKVMSGTEFMTSGAAYGNGIYCSNSFQMSYGYSNKLQTVTNVKSRNIIGIFEFLTDPKVYQKAPGIYVINNDKVLLLRYLVVTNNIFSQGTEIDKYFIQNKNITHHKSYNNLEYNILRLKKEHLLLSHNPSISSVITTDNLSWNVIILNKKYGEITLKIIFNNYPINPPTLKHISQNKKKLFVDDTIMFDELNPVNWTINNNLSKIITKINKYIEDI